MLAETGDRQFRLGHLLSDTYEQIMLSPVLLDTLERTMTEGMPMPCLIVVFSHTAVLIQFCTTRLKAM